MQGSERELVGERFSQGIIDSDSVEMRYRFKVKGEKWGFHRTEVLRCFPFPVIKGYVGYVPEGIIWSAIAEQFKTRYVNEMLRVYWINQTTGSDQITQCSSPFRYAAGRSLWHQLTLNQNIRWFKYAPTQFVISAVQYARLSFHIGDGLSKQVSKLNNILAKVLWLLALPLGLSLYLKDTRATK